MEFKHGLDEWPSLGELILLGLQWLAISVPGIIIAGKLVGSLSYETIAAQSVYLQKLSFVVSVALFLQVIWGHRLPLILGPSTVLLIGVITNSSFGPHVVYSSILLGGLALSALSLSGLLGWVQKLFTPRVIAVVLVLIALTLMPTVMNLIRTPYRAVSPSVNVIFALTLSGVMFLSHRLPGALWKSTLILWAMIAGSIAYYLFYPQAIAVETAFSGRLAASLLVDVPTPFTVNPGVVVSFLFCFFALAINDLGSIQSMKELLNPSGMPQRIRKGIALTGLANALAGFLGIVGPVNFSLSPGVISATRSASRFTLLPASVFLLLLSFSPFLLNLLGNIPPAVIGGSLIYILYYQVTAGITIVFSSRKDFILENGLVFCLPALAGTLIAFIPPSLLHSFPLVLRPIVGNGFVMGVFSVLLLEHVIFRDKLINK